MLSYMDLLVGCVQCVTLTSTQTGIFRDSRNLRSETTVPTFEFSKNVRGHSRGSPLPCILSLFSQVVCGDCAMDLWNPPQYSLITATLRRLCEFMCSYNIQLYETELGGAHKNTIKCIMQHKFGILLHEFVFNCVEIEYFCWYFFVYLLVYMQKLH